MDYNRMIKYTTKISGITYNLEISREESGFDEYLSYISNWLEEFASECDKIVKENYEDLVLPILVKFLLKDGVDDGFSGKFTDTYLMEKIYIEIKKNKEMFLEDDLENE